MDKLQGAVRGRGVLLGTSGRPLAAARSRRQRRRGCFHQIPASAGSGVNSDNGVSSEYLSTLKAYQVVPCAEEREGESVSPASFLNTEAKEKQILIFLSHFGDLTSWEYAQKLLDNFSLLQEKAAPGGVFVIGLGSASAGRKFCELLNFPLANLYADEDGRLYRELGFELGFMPDANISPYLKLLPMLAGIGSPGTIQEVLRGYVGDRDAKQIFGKSPFDILGDGYQRPFELATLRLSNMIGILPNWGELVSKDELITMQGATMVFEGTELLHLQKDAGILKYASIDKLIEALE